MNGKQFVTSHWRPWFYLLVTAIACTSVFEACEDNPPDTVRLDGAEEFAHHLYDLIAAGDSVGFDRYIDSSSCVAEAGAQHLIRFFCQNFAKAVQAYNPETMRSCLNRLANCEYLRETNKKLLSTVAEWDSAHCDSFVTALELNRKVADGSIALESEISGAIDIFDALGCSRWAGEVYYGRANLLFGIEKDYWKADEFFSRSATRALETGAVDLLCKSIIGKANCASKTGRQSESLQLLDSVAQLATACNLQEQIAPYFAARGIAYYYMVEHRRACDALLRAGREYQKLNDTENVLWSLRTAAYCLDELGEADSASALYRKALENARVANDIDAAYRIYLNNAVHIRSRDDTAGMRDTLNLSLLFFQSKDRNRLATTYLRLGQLDLIAGNVDSAECQLHLALENYADIRDSIYPIKEIVEVWAKRSNGDSLVAYASLGLRLIERARKNMPHSSFRQTYLTDKFDLVERLVLANVRAHRYSEALQIAEASRAESLKDALEEDPLDYDSAQSARMDRIEQRISETMFDVRTCALDSTALLTSQFYLQQMFDSLSYIQLSAASRNPQRTQSKTDPHRLSFETERSDSTVQLYYFTYNDGMLVFFREDDSLTAIDVAANEPRAGELLTRAVSLLAKEPQSVGDRTSITTLLDELAFLIPSAIRLRLHPDVRVQVFPSGVLCYLPLEAIRLDNRYLGEIVDFEYYPSLTMRDRLYRRGDHSRQIEQIDVLGGSRFSSPSAECYTELEYLSSYINLPDLPDVSEQTESLRHIFANAVNDYSSNPDQVSLLMGGNLSNADILHFSTHGVVFDQNLDFSGLVFPLDPGLSRGAVIRPSQIAELKLAAPLVVLTACRSGRGIYVSGEGLLGFSRSFLIAGAQAVVTNLWQIESKPSMQFLGLYYQALHEGQRSARALRHARARMITDPYFDSPYYWASFISIGNWGE